ncbi:MAG TPA: hypothetical protein VLG50_08955, partial [Candidatus Saccharimonadales bacterium]|nr:hypothetical protein [Candidatus Saccharimonadales bacterium]
MKMYKNLVCLSLLFLSQSWVQAQQESTDTLLLESSNGLNTLIADAQENGTLSQQEQKHYVEWYVQFKKAITTLKNQGEDVSQLEQIYLDRYQDWAVELVTNSDLFLELFEPGDDETEQDAQEALSPEEEAYDKLRVEKMQEIYSNVENNALKAQQAFSTQVKLQLNNLGSFSTKHVQDFTAYLSSSLQSFIGSMRV